MPAPPQNPLNKGSEGFLCLLFKVQQNARKRTLNALFGRLTGSAISTGLLSGLITEEKLEVIESEGLGEVFLSENIICNISFVFL